MPPFISFPISKAFLDGPHKLYSLKSETLYWKPCPFSILLLILVCVCFLLFITMLLFEGQNLVKLSSFGLFLHSLQSVTRLSLTAGGCGFLPAIIYT